MLCRSCGVVIFARLDTDTMDVDVDEVADGSVVVVSLLSASRNP